MARMLLKGKGLVEVSVLGWEAGDQEPPCCCGATANNCCLPFTATAASLLPRRVASWERQSEVIKSNDK